MGEKKNPTNKTCQGCSVREYFKHVDKNIKEELKALFKIDFEMFGYSDDDIWYSDLHYKKLFFCFVIFFVFFVLLFQDSKLYENTTLLLSFPTIIPK